MKIKDGKIIINKRDLNRKVVVIRNAKSELELQQAQFAAMEASPGCFAIKEESFKKYNDFRYQNKYKRLDINQVMVLDIRQFEQQENFSKFSQKQEPLKNENTL